MKRGLALAVALAGCSAEPAAEQSRPTPAPTASAAAQAPTGASLTGAISNLQGDISDLNVRITDTRTIVDLPADTLFEFDKVDLSEGAAANLAKVAELIRSGGPGAIDITGHTDAKGVEAYNQALSERRARAVAGWMGEQVGVRQRAFTVIGKGETQPVAPNARPDGSDDPDGRARNRRVEVSIPR